MAEHTCANCGKAFRARSTQRRYCSIECFRKRPVEQDAERRQKISRSTTSRNRAPGAQDAFGARMRELWADPDHRAKRVAALRELAAKKHAAPHPVDARFWAYVEQTPTCWLWTAYKISTGYGYIWRDGKYARAHRVAWELLRGPIPEGLEIDHLCRNTSCVNPDHLEPVTRQENLRRRSEARHSSVPL